MNINTTLPVPRWVRHVRNRHVFLIDALFVAASVIIAFDLRLETLFPTGGMRNALVAYLLAALAVRLSVLVAMGIYNCYWLYADTDDLFHLTIALSVSSLGLGVVFVGVVAPLWLNGFPRSVLIIDWLVSLMLIGGARFVLRKASRLSHRLLGAEEPVQQVSVLIAGAGAAGTLVAREVTDNPALGIDIIGFVDDDPAKVGSRVNGMQVLGTCDDLPWLILKHKADQVIIAMPTASGAAIRQIREKSKQVGATIRIMPALHEIISGRVSLQQIREVQIEDLLAPQTGRNRRQGGPQSVAGQTRRGDWGRRVHRPRAVPAGRTGAPWRCSS